MKTKLITLQVLSAGLIALGLSAPAHAIATLKQVQVTNGSQIDLLFDTKISKSQIKTEFFNDVIQISLNDVSVYPAKISSVSGGSITKIFAYQYAPKLVRCRLSVKGKAESYKDKIQLITSDSGSAGESSKMLTVRLGPAVVAAVAETQAAHVQAQEPPSDTAKLKDIDERALLERVLKNNPPALVPATKSEKDIPLGTPVVHSETHMLTDGKALPSPMGALGKLAFVVALFCSIAFVVKRFWKGRAEAEVSGAGLMNSLGKFTRQLTPQLAQLSLKKTRSKKMIEVISNHHLGPKKSIAVVRVAGRMLVLGITDEAINLITQISEDPNADSSDLEFGGGGIEEVLGASGLGAPSAGAISAGPAIFSDILQAESTKPVMGTPVANGKLARSQVSATSAPVFPNLPPFKDVRVTNYGMNAGSAPAAPKAPAINATTAASLSGVRAQIRNKLEGLKQI
jgi:flagellar biogenesis protein FliO